MPPAIPQSIVPSFNQTDKSCGYGIAFALGHADKGIQVHVAGDWSVLFVRDGPGGLKFTRAKTLALLTAA